MEKSDLNQESKGKYLLPASSLYMNKGATFESRLPNDIIAIILSRLPVKSIVRFRCVCKQWFYLSTEDSHFIAQHGNESLRRPILLPDFTVLSTTKVRLYEIGPSGDTKDVSVHIKLDGWGTLSVSNPANGLVYLGGCLLNPFTRDVIQLPRSTRCGRRVCVGLGFDESFRGQCKIVRLICIGHLDHCICEVLTVGTQEWRYVGDAPHMVPSGRAVFLNGVVHWLAYISYEPLHLGIFAFDVKYEKFQFIPIPMTLPYVSLLELRRHICLVLDHMSLESGFPRRFFRISMLKDYEKNEWEQVYNIDVSNWLDRCQFELYETLIIEVQDGKILMQNSWGTFSYDFQSKTLHKLSSYPGPTAGVLYGHCHIITESLVSPRSLLKQSINS